MVTRGEGWTRSRATHTLASGLCVALHLPEIPSGEAWCDSVELNDLSMGLCAWTRARLHVHAHNISPSQGLHTKSVCTDEPT